MKDYSIIKEMVDEGHFAIHEKFDNWEDALRAAVKPMVDTGVVMEEYAQRVIDMVHEYGPYICLMPHVAVPHAMAPELVLSDAPCISFMKVNEPVVFSNDENEHSELFFVLAAPSGEKHMQGLMELAEFLEDNEVVETLLSCKTEEDFAKLLK